MSTRSATLDKDTQTRSQAAEGSDSLCMGMEMPKPQEQHAWLQRFVGTWDAELEMSMNPASPPSRSRGVDTWRLLGGFWAISEGENLDFPFRYLMTLGYDPVKEKYIGTWADTMTSHGWRYEGSVDASGRILTLDTDAPFPPGSGKTTKFRDVMEFVTDNHRLYTSSMQLENGEWIKHLTINLRRRN